MNDDTKKPPAPSAAGEPKFIERRREHRLPYMARAVFSDGKQSATSYAINVSRGGLFLTSMDPFPIGSTGFLAFLLPNQPTSLCVRAKVAHIVFDRQRCEVDCGMGFQFLELSDQHRAILNTHMLNEQANYLELKRVLAVPSPNATELARGLRKMPHLEGLDLLALRYKVTRVCTVFESPLDDLGMDAASGTLGA